MNTARPRIRLCLEQLEDRIVLSSSPIDLTFATTTDARTVSVNYTISGDLTGQNVRFNIYRTAGYNSLSSPQLIGTATIPSFDSTDLTPGAHTGVRLSLMAPNGQPVTALTPNTALPFVVVVANLDGSSASFETHVLGVIAHGLEFDPFLIFLDQVPQWETQMATDLMNIDGYQAAIPFNWIRLSVLPFPFAIEIASNLLYAEVVAEANQLAGQHPGDVVDINFIGHSRGAVVISNVLQDLVGTTDPALQGGYMEMTLLDPHPANLFYSQFSWASFLPAGGQLAAFVTAFELLTRDPQVIVPSNVNEVNEFDQQTPTGQLGFLLGALANINSNSSFAIDQLLEFALNLWGEPAASLPNHSGQPIDETSLTNFSFNSGLIGHSDVPLWYLANVVDPNETFNYSG